MDRLEPEHMDLLEKQNARLVPEFRAQKLEAEARKNWDLFYKRNQNRFFKDRHWTTREFQELTGGGGDKKRILLEVGCGVGNFVFPLLDENPELFIYCCDFSPRAVQLVREHPEYKEERVKAFECDITASSLLAELGACCVDIVSMVFVLSAIHPDNHKQVFENLFAVLKPGGFLLFRDYAVFDMTMIRFGAGTKIGEHFYARQDGTRTYFFQVAELEELAEMTGFQILENKEVDRRTINIKEGVDVGRIFIQSKFRKPEVR